jgi:hypothetical protein
VPVSAATFLCFPGQQHRPILGNLVLTFLCRRTARGFGPRLGFAAQGDGDDHLGLREQQLALLVAVLITPPEAGDVGLAWSAAMETGYAAPIWMTFKQARELKASERKGEKGTLVVYADRITRTETDADTVEESEQQIPFMKGYTVFNVEQIEGLPEHYYAAARFSGLKFSSPMKTRVTPARFGFSTKFSILWQRVSTCIINPSGIPCLSRNSIRRSKIASHSLLRAKLSSVMKNLWMPCAQLRRGASIFQNTSVARAPSRRAPTAEEMGNGFLIGLVQPRPRESFAITKLVPFAHVPGSIEGTHRFLRTAPVSDLSAHGRMSAHLKYGKAIAAPLPALAGNQLTSFPSRSP